MNGLKIVVQQRTEPFAYTKTLQKSSVLDYIHYNKKLKTKLGCMKKYKLAMFVLSLVILAGIIIYANPVVLARLWAESNYTYLLVGLGISLVAIVFGVLKWKVLLKDVSFREIFPVQLLGWTISNFTPGKAAEPAKAVLLKIRKGVDVSSSLSSIIWERLTDVIALLIFSAVAISSISATSNFFLAGAVSIIVFSIILVVAFTVLYSRRFGMKFFRLFRKFPIIKRLPENFMDLFYKVKIKKRNLLKCFALAIITWGIEGFILYFCLGAFGIYVNPLLLSGIVALSVMIGIASSLPGGLGTTEVVMTFLLGLNGVESSIAVAASITFRFMTIWFVNLLGGISFIHMSRKFEIKKIW